MYATVADFVAAFGEEEAIARSNLDDASIEAIDASVILAALKASTADLDSYLKSAGYALPLTTPFPPVLIDRCVNIARYKLDRNSAREEVRQRYLDAIFWCKDLAKGLASLDLAPGTSLEAAALPVFYTSDRTFTLQSLSDY
jgi:phage gp36-like protein